MTKHITLEAARRVILEALKLDRGEQIRIVLEPDSSSFEKVQENRESELWSLDLQTGRSGREDGKFFDIRPMDRGGYTQLALYQEPNVPESASGRIVGQNIIEVNRRGLIRVRETNGLNGRVIEANPSSISKGILAEPGHPSSGLFEADPQRIIGFIEVVMLRTEFPDEEGMTPEQIRRESTDGRLLASLAKLGLL